MEAGRNKHKEEKTILLRSQTRSATYSTGRFNQGAKKKRQETVFIIIFRQGREGAFRMDMS